MDRELFLQLLRGIIPGAFVGFGFVLTLFRRQKPLPADQATPRQVFAPLLIALALIGLFAIAFPLRAPSGLFDWLGWIPVLLAMIGVGAELAPWRIAAGMCALFGVALAILFAPRGEWATADLRNALISVASAAGAGAFFHLIWRDRPILLLAVATILAAGMSQVLVLGFHALKLGQVAGIGASVLGGMTAAMVLGFRKRSAPFSLAPVATVLVLFSSAALAQAPIVTETKSDWALVLLLASIPAVATGVQLLLNTLNARRVAILWICTLIAASSLVAAAMFIVLLTRETNSSGY